MSHAEQVFGTCLFVFSVSVAGFLSERTIRTVRCSGEEVTFNPLHGVRWRKYLFENLSVFLYVSDLKPLSLQVDNNHSNIDNNRTTTTYAHMPRDML